MSSSASVNWHLGEAARLNDLARLDRLLALGASVNSSEQLDSTPLKLACQKSHYGAVKRLLGAGADVNQTDSIGATVLHIALDNRDAELARLLLESVERVNRTAVEVALDATAAASVGKEVERLWVE